MATMHSWACWFCGNTWTYKNTWRGRRRLRRIRDGHLLGCVLVEAQEAYEQCIERTVHAVDVEAALRSARIADQRRLMAATTGHY